MGAAFLINIGLISGYLETMLAKREAILGHLGIILLYLGQVWANSLKKSANSPRLSPVAVLRKRAEQTKMSQDALQNWSKNV